MSASGDGKLFLDPRRPGYAGQSSHGVSGLQYGVSGSQRQLDFNTLELLEDMDLPPTHPRKNT